jgi:hypothetical protein
MEPREGAEPDNAQPNLVDIKTNPDLNRTISSVTTFQ